MCNIKTVVDDRLPINQPSRVFPVAAKDYGVFSGVLELLYRRGLAQRCGATASRSVARFRT
jgi:hypothetical protein